MTDRRMRKSGRVLLGLGAALLCAGWSFPPSADVKPAGEPELGNAPILEAAQSPVEIAPPPEEDVETIELDRSPAMPEILPSAGEDAPKVLEDIAL